MRYCVFLRFSARFCSFQTHLTPPSSRIERLLETFTNCKGCIKKVYKACATSNAGSPTQNDFAPKPVPSIALKLQSQLKHRHLEILTVDHRVIQWSTQMTALSLVIRGMIYMLVGLAWTKFPVKSLRTMPSSYLNSCLAGMKLGIQY